MPTLPNPFDTGPAHPAAPVEAAASPILTGTDDAAAEPSRFVLDEDAFLNDLEALPAFLVAPSQAYLRATDLIPMLAVLAGTRA